MPELPEVEMMRRGLWPVVGRTIERVEYPRIPYRPIQIIPSRRTLAAGCAASKIVAVDRIAKRIVVRLSNDFCIVIQPKMAGIVLLTDPPSGQHTRVIFHLEGKKWPEQFQYWDRRGLGTVALWSSVQVQHELGQDKLGPDALAIDEATFATRLRTGRRELKVALLDQRVVSGVGNIYAAEILFASRIHPQVCCSDLNLRQCKTLYREMVRILMQAIEFEGSTLADGTYRNAINGEGSYQNHHLVYDREGKPCIVCGRGTIKRIVQAQRSTFFCPHCQR